jgi:hypothetical protein
LQYEAATMPHSTLISIREHTGGNHGPNATLSFNHEGEYALAVQNPFSPQEEARELNWCTKIKTWRYISIKG